MHHGNRQHTFRSEPSGLVKLCEAVLQGSIHALLVLRLLDEGLQLGAQVLILADQTCKPPMLSRQDAKASIERTCI